jgi:hypothetical protein
VILCGAQMQGRTSFDDAKVLGGERPSEDPDSLPLDYSSRPDCRIDGRRARIYEQLSLANVSAVGAAGRTAMIDLRELVIADPSRLPEHEAKGDPEKSAVAEQDAETSWTRSRTSSTVEESRGGVTTVWSPLRISDDRRLRNRGARGVESDRCS